MDVGSDGVVPRKRFRDTWKFELTMAGLGVVAVIFFSAVFSGCVTSTRYRSDLASAYSLGNLEGWKGATALLADKGCPQKEGFSYTLGTLNVIPTPTYGLYPNSTTLENKWPQTIMPAESR